MLSEVSSLGVGLKFMFPSTVWPLITLFSCSLAAGTLLDLKESHPVFAQLSMRPLNQGRLFYRLLWNPVVHHPLLQHPTPTKSHDSAVQTCCFLCLSSVTLSLCLGSTSLSCNRKVSPDRRLEHIWGSPYLFPFSWRLQFCVCLLFSVWKQLHHVF